jgi:hypothetical protein
MTNESTGALAMGAKPSVCKFMAIGTEKDLWQRLGQIEEAREELDIELETLIDQIDGLRRQEAA